MAEEIRDLIEKIHQEGIRAAEEKARDIEAFATQRAEEILLRAQREAGEMIAAAQDRASREEVSGKALLSQAGRDLLLSLRKEINAMLGRIVLSDTRQALTPEALSGLITEVARAYRSDTESEIAVSLNKKDLEVLEQHFLGKLEKETKKTVILRPSEEISGGFTISFDKGKSCYDFTDRALADYIGTYLKPKLHRILVESGEE
jgi:V/A-type H+-transporting ATPase subunit E